MVSSVATKHRKSGSLRLVTKKARGNEYQRWQWRTHRQSDSGWTTVDVELGEELSGLRTRTLIALGELSAPLLLERWARWYFRRWWFLPAFTGRPDGAQQRTAWWLEIPRQSDKPVQLKFRSSSCFVDFRRHKKAINTAEQIATAIWENLSRDPIVELGRLQWLETEAQTPIDKIAQEQIELRRQRRAGDLDQRDFEVDERDSYRRLEDWESMQSTVRTRWDEQLTAMVKAMPRTRHEELQPRIVMLADRLQSNSQQLQRWNDQHWDGTTLRW